MAREKSLDNKVLNYLKQRGCWSIKYWAGAKFTKTGVPDILACINGRFVAIEDKADNGRPTLLQLVNLQKIRNAGGYGILLYPKDFDQFKNFILNLITNQPALWPEEVTAWYMMNVETQKNWILKLDT